MENDEDYGMDTLSLIDDDGKEYEFEIADIMERSGVEYIALIPLHDDPENILEDSGQLVMMKYSEELDESGSPFLVELSDDEFPVIAKIFMNRLADKYDFDYDEDEDDSSILN